MRMAGEYRRKSFSSSLIIPFLCTFTGGTGALAFILKFVYNVMYCRRWQNRWAGSEKRHGWMWINCSYQCHPLRLHLTILHLDGGRFIRFEICEIFALFSSISILLISSLFAGAVGNEYFIDIRDHNESIHFLFYHDPTFAIYTPWKRKFDLRFHTKHTAHPWKAFNHSHTHTHI